MSTILRRIVQFFSQYILEEFLLVILVAFFYIQPIQKVYVVSTFVFYTLLVIGLHSKMFQYGCRVAIHFVKKYRLEEILAVVLVVYFYLQPYDMNVVVSTFVVYAFVVLLLNKTFLRGWLKRVIGDVRKEYLYTILIGIVIILMGIWQVSLEAMLFIILFISFAVYDWDNRVTAGGALVSLTSCPVLLMLKQGSIAEQMAVYAYYFLVMTVVLQIIEYKHHPELYDENEYEEKH
jgi:hypothetical protein